MRLVSGHKGSDEFTEQISRLADEVKQNIGYKRQFMEWERQKTYLYNKGKEEGVVEGERKKAIEDARNFLFKCINPEIIAECTGLPLEEVQKLAEELVPVDPELQGGTRELSKIFFDKIPVIQVNEQIEKRFSTLVDNIQQEYTKQRAIEIDTLIFELYELSEEEQQVIGFVEIQ